MTTRKEATVKATETPREWGSRFWDGSIRPAGDRTEAFDHVLGFKPGMVEVVFRDDPEGQWRRDGEQPHTLEERFAALFKARRESEELSTWRGEKLTDLGLSPNPWSWGEPEHALLFQEQQIKALRREVEELKGRLAS